MLKLLRVIRKTKFRILCHTAAIKSIICLPSPLLSQQVARSAHNLGTEQANKHGPEFCPSCVGDHAYIRGEKQREREELSATTTKTITISYVVSHYALASPRESFHFRQRSLAKFGGVKTISSGTKPTWYN